MLDPNKFCDADLVTTARLLKSILSTAAFDALQHRAWPKNALPLDALFYGSSLNPRLFRSKNDEPQSPETNLGYVLEPSSLKLAQQVEDIGLLAEAGVLGSSEFAAFMSYRSRFQLAIENYRSAQFEERIGFGSRGDSSSTDAEGDDQFAEHHEGEVSDIQDQFEHDSEYRAALEGDVTAARDMLMRCRGELATVRRATIENIANRSSALHAKSVLAALDIRMKYLERQERLHELHYDRFQIELESLRQFSLPDDIRFLLAQAATMRSAQAIEMYDRAPTLLAYAKPIELFARRHFAGVVNDVASAAPEILVETKEHEFIERVVRALASLAIVSGRSGQFPIRLPDRSRGLVSRCGEVLRTRCSDSQRQSLRMVASKHNLFHVRCAWICIALDFTRKVLRNGFAHYDIGDCAAVERAHQFLLGEGGLVAFLCHDNEDVPDEAVSRIVMSDARNSSNEMSEWIGVQIERHANDAAIARMPFGSMQSLVGRSFGPPSGYMLSVEIAGVWRDVGLIDKKWNERLSLTGPLVDQVTSVRIGPPGRRTASDVEIECGIVRESVTIPAIVRLVGVAEFLEEDWRRHLGRSNGLVSVKDVAKKLQRSLDSWFGTLDSVVAGEVGIDLHADVEEFVPQSSPENDEPAIDAAIDAEYEEYIRQLQADGVPPATPEEIDRLLGDLNRPKAPDDGLPF